MNPLRITLVALAAGVALVATACGGNSSSVSPGDVAVVDGTPVSKTDLDQLVGLAKKGFAAQKQDFPKAGTPEYQNLQAQYLAYLVQRAEYRQEAEKLGITVTKKDIDKAENDLIKSRFAGKRADYEKALQQQGFTRDDARMTLETSVLTQKIFDRVTKDVKVTDQEVQAYYTQNQAQYGTPESRDVRHILIAEKDKGGKVDYAKSKAKADEIYAQLKAGADFAALAKANSADPGSKDTGGKLTVSRGQTVPEFDKTAFALKLGEISKPVKTQYGYHIIEALSAVRPAKTTSLAEVKDSIRATLLQQKRTDEMSAWAEDMKKHYDGKVTYAAGFEPPAIPEQPTTTQ